MAARRASKEGGTRARQPSPASKPYMPKKEAVWQCPTAIPKGL